MNNTIQVGLLGLGTVGTGVVRLIEGHQEDLKSKIGANIHIKKILVKDINKDRSIEIDQDKFTENALDVIEDPDIDIVVEVMGGIEETKAYMIEALRRGKHIVTANKDLMALHGAEILHEANVNQSDVMYEASVAGGIPILRSISEGFSSDRITKMMGIINGTTNYILSKMSEEGADFEDVLHEAQQLGYAEADPTSDVGGFDAAYKIAILGTLGFHMTIAMEDVLVEGITNVSKEDIAYGKKLGYDIKLLAIAERKEDQVYLSVQPTMIKNTHPLASVGGVFNAIYVHGEAVGETMFYGPGAGELPTATSVVADVVSVAKNIKLNVNGRTSSMPYKEKKMMDEQDVMSKNFLLLHVQDKAGVLAKITEIFAACHVSIESVLQQPVEDHDFVELVMITHEASKSNFKQVLGQLEALDVVQQIRSMYRVEA
ncbi:homoserine dehydrogenase [Longirhabdus pacifica]|uniref:homoserine dehydrogenase n=1 Tax=Longirhabdus pacifica TaxID=2305227 RepID=UPI001008A94D|nr:homoserine dehydrogenase [Longirhabdus pacifica]